MSHAVKPSEITAKSDEDISILKRDSRDPDKSKDRSDDKEKDEDRKKSKSDDPSDENKDRKQSKKPEEDGDRKQSKIPEKDEERKQSKIPEKDEDRKQSKIPEKDEDRKSKTTEKDEDRKSKITEKDEDRKSKITEKDEDRKSKIPEKDEDRKSKIPEKDEDRKDEPKKSETPSKHDATKSGESKSHVQLEDVRQSADWKRHEPTGDEEKVPERKEKKSRADSYTFKEGKNVSCGDAKRYKIEIEQLSNEVRETFAASLFAMKKSYSDREAMKQLKKMAKDLSELLNEIAKSFISKLHKVEKEKARTSLRSAAELFLTQAEGLRSEFEDPAEYAEEIQLCIDTSMTELKRVERSLRSSSDQQSNLIKRAMIIALEEMIEIASTPFEKKKSL